MRWKQTVSDRNFRGIYKCETPQANVNPAILMSNMTETIIAKVSLRLSVFMDSMYLTRRDERGCFDSGR